MTTSPDAVATSYTPIPISDCVGNGEIPTTQNVLAPTQKEEGLSDSEIAKTKEEEKRAKKASYQRRRRMYKKLNKSAKSTSAKAQPNPPSQPADVASTFNFPTLPAVTVNPPPDPALFAEIAALKAELVSLQHTRALEMGDFNITMSVLASENAGLQQQLASNNAYYSSQENHLMNALQAERQLHGRMALSHAAQQTTIAEYQARLADCESRIAAMAADKAAVEVRQGELANQLAATHEREQHTAATLNQLSDAVSRVKHLQEQINTTLIPEEFTAYKDLLSEKVSAANTTIDCGLAVFLSNSIGSIQASPQSIDQRVEEEVARVKQIRDEFAQFIHTEFAPIIKRLRAQINQKNGVPVLKRKS